MKNYESIIDDYSEFVKNLRKKFTIKFTTEEEDLIIKRLPPMKPLITFSGIYQLEGKHFPCIHDAIPNISKRVRMKKFDNGAKVYFSCNTDKEAKKATTSIESTLGEYGYKAYSKHDIVVFQTSEDTSIIPILSRLGLKILYCEHSDHNEKIIFGEYEKQQPYSLIKTIKDKEKKISKKLNKQISLPHKLNKIHSEICLPDIECYDPNFMAFLIEQKPTKQQMCTFLTLYHLAKIGIPFPIVNVRNLIRIVHDYTKISKRVLENQLFDNEFPLQKRLASIYTFDEIELNMSLELNDVDDDEIRDHFVNSFKEFSESDSSDD